MSSFDMLLRCTVWVTAPRGYPHLFTRWKYNRCLFFDMARMLKGLLDELTFGNMVVEIPTYVRNDNSDASYHVDAVNTVTNEKRLNGFLESNREELGRNNWLIVGYNPGNINTSDGLAASLSSANLRNLLENSIFRISTEGRKNEIGRKIPDSERYIVYRETIQGVMIWTLTCDARLA